MSREIDTLRNNLEGQVNTLRGDVRALTVRIDALTDRVARIEGAMTGGWRPHENGPPAAARMQPQVWGAAEHREFATNHRAIAVRLAASDDQSDRELAPVYEETARRHEQCAAEIEAGTPPGSLNPALSGAAR